MIGYGDMMQFNCTLIFLSVQTMCTFPIDWAGSFGQKILKSGFKRPQGNLRVDKWAVIDLDYMLVLNSLWEV